MKLYSNRLSPNCRKVHAVIAHTGAEVEEVVIDFAKGEHKQPDYLALNPNGKVPTLVDGDTVLWESNAIACYLASTRDSPLWPKSNQRYDILRWMFWESNHLSQAVGMIFGQKIFNAANPDQTIIDKGLAQFSRLAAVLNGRLETADYLSGDGLTVADVAVGVWFGYASTLELPVADYRHIGRWLERLGQLPAWQEVLPQGK